jgi:saccharopine dehydrogenase-like NADP-dependent oxidoreductase
MQKILVLGAGRSSSSLISYLLHHASAENWHVYVGDLSEQAARERLGNSPNGTFIPFDIENPDASAAAIASADVVISLLPAFYHPHVAQHCLVYNKHLLTASYVSDDMKALHEQAEKKGLLFLNECGLDPGIDHMSAMQIIDRIRHEGGEVTSFESFTGGLIAPETDPDNPWRYKFTWNPRNVVTAGQGTAKYLQGGEFKYIPYQQLFLRTTAVHVPGYGEFEGYANRDSLKYRETYQLQNIKTMLRGTLRFKGYCSAWNLLVQLGCCDDTYLMEGVPAMTHHGFIRSFLDRHSSLSTAEQLAALFHIDVKGPEITRLKWAGLFEEEPVGLSSGTPAAVLERILNKRWKLQPQDKDLIVMWHRFGYTQHGEQKEVQATLVAKGEDAIHTAMAKTVGLPLAIAAKLLVQNKIRSRGVVIPVAPEFYNPILKELEESGIELKEQ